MQGGARWSVGWLVLAWLAGPALAAEGDCTDYGELGAGAGPRLGTIKEGEARVPFVKVPPGARAAPDPIRPAARRPSWCRATP